MLAGTPAEKKKTSTVLGRTVWEFGQGDERIVISTPELTPDRWKMLKRYVEEVLKPTDDS